MPIPESIEQRIFGPCLIILAVLLVYAPGLSGGFIFDDYPNIVGNPALTSAGDALPGLRKIIEGGISGPAHRSISMLSFALNRYVAGDAPFSFKLVNIFVHAVNGILMYFLLRLVLQTATASRGEPVTKVPFRTLALFMALVWSLHPIHLTSVLYVVQRMNSLSALFVLAGLLFYTAGRSRMLEFGRGHFQVAAALGIFTVPAVLSKENGILLPLFAGLLEVCLFRFRCRTDRDRRFLRGLFLIIVVLPLSMLLVVIALQPDLVLAGYSRRSFTLGQRLLTEGRVLWLYIYLIFVPNTRDLSLFHDDIELSFGLLQPPSTLFAIAGLVGLALVAWKMRRQQPLVCFGICFFLAGHSLESTVLSLELVHEHRNYLPSAGLLLALLSFLPSADIRMISPAVRYGAITALLLAFASVTAARAVQWGDDLMLRYHEVLHHPDSPRANYEMGRIYALMLEEPGFTGDRQILYEGAREHFLKANSARGGSVEALIGLVLLDSTYGKMTEERYLRDLYVSLASQTPGATGSMAMRALLRCNAMRTCQVHESIVQAVIHSLLSNPELDGRDVSLLLQAVSEYLWNRQHEYSLAQTAAEYAVRIDANGVAPRILLASILMETGDRTGAARAIEYAKAGDVLNLYNEAIEKLYSRLNKLNGEAGEQ